MSKANTFETDLLAKVFNNTALSWDAITNIFVALHTADPGEAGSQTTSETAYAAYARVAVARTTAGWTVSSAGGVGTVVNVSAISFPQCSGASSQVTYFSVGQLTSGAGQIFYSGALSGGGLAVTNGVTPSFAAGNLTITED
jgi:hypothetical protein